MTSYDIIMNLVFGGCLLLIPLAAFDTWMSTRKRRDEQNDE